MEVKLASKIAALEKRLEANPEPWFAEPVGWLSKPDFKRKEQSLTNYKKDGTSKGRSMTIGGMMGKKTYSRRYFCLVGTTLSYYREIDAETPAGAIKLDDVVSVEESVVPDAPANSFDLRTKERLFTLAADNSTEMVNWALAITAAISNKGTTGRQGRAVSQEAGGEIQWKRFDHCFETKQPLLLNVKGVANRNDLQQVTNHWIVVTGFAKGKTGEPGPAENAGTIKAMDIVVGCNGIDLTELTFNECMSVIRHADWPKTLHFIRDPNTANLKPTLKEAWAKFGTAGSLRRRYLEIKEGEVLYSKPTPGGAISATPDGRMYDLLSLRKVEDRSAGDDEQFQVIMTTKHEGLQIIVAVETLDAMEEWVDSICQAFEIDKPEKLEVVDIADIEANASVTGDLLIFDEITCAFNVTRAVLTAGETPSLRCGTRLLGLGSPGSPSPVTSMRSLQAPKCVSLNAQYQVVMETNTGTVILGMSTDEELLKWVVGLSGVLSLCVPPPKLPAGIDEVETDQGWNPVESFGSSGDKDTRTDVNVDGIDCDFCGYMFKKGDGKSMMGSTKYRERFWVLKQGKLHYYKTAAQALGDTATGTINMGDVHEVRISKAPASPDLALDIWTRAGRVFIVVPLSSDSQNKWLTALQNAVDENSETDVIKAAAPKGLSKRMSLMAVSAPPAADSDPSNTRAAEESRRAQIKASIKKDGILMKKTDNRVTGAVTMKKRYFCLTTSQIAYYETEADMYAEDSDALGSISMHQVGEVATSLDVKFLPGCAIEVSAQIGEAAKKDDDGTRVYVLEAKDAVEAKEWMEAICVTSGRLKLDMVQENVYKSSSNTESDTRRVDQINRQANIYKGGGGAAMRGGRGGRGGRGRPTVMALGTPAI